MMVVRHLILAILLYISTSAIALAQVDAKPPVQPEPIVTVSVTANSVRFAAPSSVVRMQVEVFSTSGQSLFEGNIKGNVLDWSLQDSSGARLSNGSYVCLITAKSLSGKLSQRIGTVSVQDSSVRLQTVDAAQLTSAEQQAIGPLEENAALTILSESNAPATTVATHNGQDGQLTSTIGALTFHTGNVFTGADTEQMRITPEGKVGIGTDKPQVKLDVAGTIRASNGIQFADGTVQTTGLSGRTDAQGNLVPTTAGTGTLGKLARWSDNNGTLGDSLISDTGQLLQINGTALQLMAAPTTLYDTNLLYLNSTSGTAGILAGNIPSYSAFNGPFFAMRGNTYPIYPNQRGLFTISAGNVPNPQGDEGSVKFNTGADQLRMVIKPSGYIGIGTSIPKELLDVAGNLNVSGNAIIAGNIAAKYQDVAEWVPARQQMAPGSVVILDTTRPNAVTLSKRAYDTHIAGVVSARPGVILGEAGTGKVLVATTGRVRVKVDATRHPILIGDLLVTSNQPGVAMKSQPIRIAGTNIHRPGTIIGKALEPLASGCGDILVLLSLQ